MKFNNEKDLLKFLIKNMDSNKRCYDSELNICEYSDVQTICKYLDSLKQAGYISVYMGGVFEVHDAGISFIKDKSHMKSFLTLIIKWIFGIITALLTAYFIFELGLN